ncbi:unnamed protein product [Clonostachys byssicola]|uniref:Kynurenine formamidase n=1 Tax=Clonostachys byssicola TaxID=160290 RepID=A0A9N9Y9W6_9HYPO|nr:unnamed protein product [Clonostachys byssicola]
MDQLRHTRHSYGDNVRQRISVWEPSSDIKPQSDGVWAIFIHGGAWGDPTNTEEDFIPSIKHVLASYGSLAQSPIRSFASIDYRLSPHPKHPQGPETPASELRAAKHPDHINDVWSALQFLVQEYDLASGRYILVGHSAGATLAYQLCMGSYVLDGQVPPPSVPLPTTIIGISGIYDLDGIDQRHGGNYAGFITSAFGSDRSRWRIASPACCPDGHISGRNLPSHNILAWSPEDTLVDEPEIDEMVAKLEASNANLLTLKDLTGEHDHVWQEGSQVCRLINLALEHLEKSP